MKISIRVAGLALVVSALWAVPTPGNAWISAAGSCFAGVFSPSCTTPYVNDGTFRYLIVNPAPLQWSVTACGSGTGSTCDSAYWENGDPKIGTLKATRCPCIAWMYLGYPGQIIKNPVYNSTPVGIITSLGP